MITAYLSLGSNLGDRAENLRAALRRLERPALHVEAVSPIYETAPVGDTPEPVPAYLNCAARLQTGLAPLDLLDAVQEVEREGGRTPTYRWGPRVIDVDVVLYDGLAMDDPRLQLPHPRAFERAFVLVPLRELTPGLVFPDGTTVEERLRDPLVAGQAVTRYGE